ncbi:serine hydrolase [Altererythrobacter sp. MTPC7]|uniref:serine hydrolase n=1 Tax=Altererythrobacter sp. MTPC7 TaxID=3056567 RepID=UPI0036F1ABAD
MRTICLPIAACLLGMSSIPAAAQDAPVPLELEARAEALGDIFRGSGDAETLFGSQFLAEVPPDRFAQLVVQITAQYGEFVDVERVDPRGPLLGTVYLHFENAIASGPITLDPNPPHKIAGLMLSSFTPVDDSLADIRADLADLPGTVSAYFAPLGRPDDATLDIGSDRQMAIGSTFKLYVLSALGRSIEAGERDWSDVVTIDIRSFPSGTMHLWPEGAPATLQTLATQMIAGSDNTATDVLIDVVGRRAVEAEVIASGHSRPSRLIPLLSTLELFALKGSETNRTRWLAADEDRRRRILADFRDDVGGDPEKIVPPRFSSPTAIDTIEWFASGRDIASILGRITQLRDPVARNILAVYPAMPVSLTEEWNYTGYKGGSEPGVLNLTWLLRDSRSEWHVLTMSWNNPDAALEHSRLESIAQRLMRIGR